MGLKSGPQKTATLPGTGGRAKSPVWVASGAWQGESDRHRGQYVGSGAKSIVDASSRWRRCGDVGPLDGRASSSRRQNTATELDEPS